MMGDQGAPTVDCPGEVYGLQGSVRTSLHVHGPYLAVAIELAKGS